MIETELIAGLYDENDNLIVTYEESGLIADADYTSSSYKTDAGSGYSTFNRYSAAKKVILPVSIASIGTYAFDGCSNLTSITIQDGVTSIGDSAFRACPKLTSIIIPDSVISIDSYAFYNCSSLTSAMLGNGMTTIGTQAFDGCSKLTSVSIPDSIISIGDAAFAGCPRLVYNDYNDGSYLGNSENLYVVLMKGTATSGIHENTKIIYRYAFENCSGLTSITIPSSSRNIGYKAFYNCTNLTTVTFAENSQCSSIESSVFRDCSSLTEIVIQSNVQNIGDAAFNGCTNLTTVTFAENSQCSSIGISAFGKCSSLTSITIPASVISIGNSAFSNCSNLTSVMLGNGVTSIGSDMFYGCSALVEMTIPFVGAKAGVTSSDTYQYPFGYLFGTSSFTGGAKTTQYYCGSSTSSTISSTYYLPTSLKKVTVTGGNILFGAFYNCSNLTNITIPNGVTSIGSAAFKYCTSLMSITIPDSVMSISYDAFWNCAGLTSVTIGNGVTSINSSAFYGCSSLTSITIPDSVTSISASAFYGCSSLQKIYITDLAAWCQISGLSNLMSSGASNKELYLNGVLLTDLVIPNSVQTIEINAFNNCSSFTSVTIPASVTSIGSGAFSGCSALVEMTIPFVGAKAGVTSSDTNQYPFGYIFGSSSYTGGVKTMQYYYGNTTTRPGYSIYCIPAALKKVTVTGGNILYGAFYSCSNLTDVALGGNITNIDERAFYNCSNLTTLDLPDSLTYLSAQAFIGCTALKELYIGSGLSELSMSYINYSDGLYVDLRRAHNLEIVNAHGNVYFGPALTGLGLNGQFKSSDDGSLYKWNNDLNAWELVWLMPEATVLPSYFENSPVASIFAYCIDDCHTNMFNKDLVIPDTVKLLDMRPLRVWSEKFSDYSAKCRIHLLATSVTALTYSSERPWRDITVNVPASLVEDYRQTWTESWVQQIVSNDSLLAFVAYNQNLQETLPKKFVSIEEAELRMSKLQDELQEQRDTIDEQQSLIETLRAELENTKPVIAHLTGDAWDSNVSCDYTLSELFQIAQAEGTIRLRLPSNVEIFELALLWANTNPDTPELLFGVTLPNNSGWFEARVRRGEEGEDLWEVSGWLPE